MKRTIVNLPFFALLLFIATSCSNSASQETTEENEKSTPVENGFTPYTDNESGFSISYPNDWRIVDTLVQPMMVFVVIEDNPDTTDMFSENLSILKIPNRGETIDAILEQNVNAVHQYRPEYKVNSKKITTKKGLEVGQVTMNFEELGIQLETTSSFFVRDTVIFSITQTSEEKNKSEYLPLFDQMVHSFEWLDH